MILVTGATGTNGTEILKRLAATADVQVRAMVRNLDHASAIASPDAEVVEGTSIVLRRFSPHSLALNVVSTNQFFGARRIATDRVHRRGTAERRCAHC